MLKKAVVILLIFSVLMFSSINVYADTDRKVNTTTVSEYISDDMFENYETVSQTVGAVAASAGDISISATSAILIEASTGKVIFEKNPDEKRPPASITKIMTLLLTMEALESKKININDYVTASAHAVSMGGSQIWLKEGEKMSVNDLIKATAVASANDASVVLGENIAGSEETFVSMMNKKASELGMSNTHFENCCGLDVDGHLSTARDISLMARELLKHNTIREYSGIWMDYLRDGQTQLVNTNKLVRFYEGATGLKTGTTGKAGYCVCASAKRNNTEFIAVILNGETGNKRFTDAKALLDFGFANYEIYNPDLSNTVLEPISVTRGVETHIDVSWNDVLPILVKKGTQGKIEANISLPKTVEAPIAIGDLIGKITFTYKGEILGECPIYSQMSVEKITFWKAFLKMLWAVTKI